MNKSLFLNVIMFFCVFCIWTNYADGQRIKLYASPRGVDVIDNFNQPLQNPFCGGWINPQISNIDLNGDGRQDLFVFMPGYGDNRILTFLNIGNGQYQYYPEYESFFPHLQSWAVLVDYNHDGKPDIFTYARQQQGIDVWENISDTGGLKFKRVTYDPNPNNDLLCFVLSHSGDTSNVYASSNGIPIIADIDGDGDIDIVAFDPNQFKAFFYRNMAVERGLNLNNFHFDFTNPVQCWGRFATTSNPDTPAQLMVGCGKQFKSAAHGGTSLLAVDMDNDGDLDVLLGNLYDKQLAQLQNGKMVNGIQKNKNDTIISVDSAVLGEKTKIIQNYYPFALLADCNGDGLKDLVVTPWVPDTPVHKTLLYTNTGNTKPGNHFKFLTDNFLQETMMDAGEHTAPTFLDYNNDGLMDMVVATRANQTGGYAYDHLVLYKNTGTANKAVYQKVDEDLGHITHLKLAYLAPAFADIDGDGRPDLFLGTKDGRVLYFKNMADSAGTFSFKQENLFPNVGAESCSTPCLAHLNTDSLFDLVLGHYAGSFIYYKNTGTSKKPSFTKITDSFGHVNTNDIYYSNYKYDKNNNKIDSTRYMNAWGRSSPVIADFDHDGKLDMVSGSFYGEMFFWFGITDNLNGKFTRTDSLFYNTLKKSKETKTFGLYTMPAAADLDNDKLPELIIGNNMGGLIYYGSKIVKLGIDPDLPPATYTDVDFKIYPNPAKNQLHISLNSQINTTTEITLINMLGETIYHTVMVPGEIETSLDLSSCKSGMYFISLKDKNGRSGVQKLIIGL